MEFEITIDVPKTEKVDIPTYSNILVINRHNKKFNIHAKMFLQIVNHYAKSKNIFFIFHASKPGQKFTTSLGDAYKELTTSEQQTQALFDNANSRSFGFLEETKSQIFIDRDSVYHIVENSSFTKEISTFGIGDLRSHSQNGIIVEGDVAIFEKSSTNCLIKIPFDINKANLAYKIAGFWRRRDSQKNFYKNYHAAERRLEGKHYLNLMGYIHTPLNDLWLGSRDRQLDQRHNKYKNTTALSGAIKTAVLSDEKKKLTNDKRQLRQIQKSVEVQEKLVKGSQDSFNKKKTILNEVDFNEQLDVVRGFTKIVEEVHLTKAQGEQLPTVIIVTKDLWTNGIFLTEDKILLGKYMITLDLNAFIQKNPAESIKIANLTKITVGRHHPHVDSDGACFGSMANRLIDLNNELNLVGLIEYILIYLQTTNPHDFWGQYLIYWEHYQLHGSYPKGSFVEKTWRKWVDEH